MITPGKKIIFFIDFETNYAAKNTITVFVEDSIMQTEIFDKLDNFWHHKNDKLVQFLYASDGSYNIKKKKQVANLKNITETKWVEYEWFNVSNVDITKFYNIVSRAVEISLETELKKQEDKLRSIQYDSDLSGYKSIILMRDSLLKESDWMFCVDVVDNIDSNTLELWKHYRQYLRDLPEQNSDIPNPWKWLIPLNPDSWKKFNAEVTEEYKEKNNYSTDAPYLSVPQHFITYKQEVKSKYNVNDNVYEHDQEKQLDNLIFEIINSL